MSRKHEEGLRSSEEQDLRIKLAVFLVPIPLILFFLLMKIRWNSFYTSIIQEDSFVEYGQFFLYAASSMIALIAGLGYLKKRYFLNGNILLLLAFIFLMVSMEEISWGQRIFYINTPVFFQQYNTHKEITLHNLKPIQRQLHLCYVLIGSFLSFGWIFTRFALSIKRLNNDVKAAVKLFIPKWYLMLFFLPVTLIYSYFVLAKFHESAGGFVVFRDQEPAELLLALGILLYVTTCFMQLKYAVKRIHK